MQRGFVYKNELAVVFSLLFVASLIGQFFSGWMEYNDELKKDNYRRVSVSEYTTSGHFISATAAGAAGRNCIAVFERSATVV